MEYAANVVQIKMIRLLSERARQNITYNCLNSHSILRVLRDDEVISDVLSLNTKVIKDECKVRKIIVFSLNKNIILSFVMAIHILKPFTYLSPIVNVWKNKGKF